MCLRAALAGTLLAVSVVVVCADGDEAGRQVTQEIAEAGRQMRKFGTMLIPLLIGIAGRLAAIIPLAFFGTIGVLLFVALSIKAFVVSILSFIMNNRKHAHPMGMGMKVMHIHHYPHDYHGGDSKFPSHMYGGVSPFAMPASGGQPPASVTHGTHLPFHPPPDFAHYNPAAPPPVYYYDSNFPPKKSKKWPKLEDWNYLDSNGDHRGASQQHHTTRNPSVYKPRLTTLDSYLPQYPPHTTPGNSFTYMPRITNVESYNPQERSDEDMPPFLYSPQGVFYPKFLWGNATERPLLNNSTVGLTPQLEKVTEKTVEDEDPR